MHRQAKLGMRRAGFTPMRSTLGLIGVLLCACHDPAAPASPQPEVVAVDWHGRGALYAGEVIGRSGGLTGVRYADGDREWVEAARIRPWPALNGQRVQVWTRGAARDATVAELSDALVHLRFDDESDAWVSRDMLYALHVTPPAPPTPPTPPQRPALHFPERPPADPAAVREGRYVLAYWAGQHATPWLCVVRSVQGGQASLQYSDSSEATVSLEEIVRVFDGRVTPRVGMRVWVMGETVVGRIAAMRAGLVQLEAGDERRWVEADEVIGAIEPVDPDRLAPGALVTALWEGESLYHATVAHRSGDRVTLAWHDGSGPDEIPVGDVVEIWGQAPQADH